MNVLVLITLLAMSLDCSNTGVSPSVSQTPPYVKSDSTGRYLEVTCGDIEGNLYLAKFKKGSLSSKCILYNSKWYSLVEFESLGGKSKFKNWKKSLKHSKTSLVFVLDTNPEITCRLVPITRAATSPAPNVPTLPSTNVSLCSLVLAFVKAYRLKGDNASLKQALHEHFSVPAISDALKLLWNHSRSELEALNFTYHERRGSEKNPLADLIIKDLLYAFDKLDSSDQIPPIFCEAVDLLKLPPFVTDLPAATVHESNLRIKDLQTNIKVSNNQVNEMQVI